MDNYINTYQWWEAVAQDLWKYCNDEEYVRDCVQAEEALKTAWEQLTREEQAELRSKGLALR